MYISMNGVYMADDGLDVRDLFAEKPRSCNKTEVSDKCQTDKCGTKLRKENRVIGFCDCCQRRRRQSAN